MKRSLNIALCSLLLAAGVLTSCHSTPKQSVTKPASTATVIKNKTQQRPKLPPVTAPDAHGSLLLETAYDWLGTPYLYGGNDRDGVDCSGFVLQVYLKATGIAMPRNSAQQAEWCSKADTAALEVGDLLFYTGRDPERVNHVAMYVGEGKMIHASSSRGVVIDYMTADYWRNHMHSAGRVPGAGRALEARTETPKPQLQSQPATQPAIAEAPKTPSPTPPQEEPDPATVVKNAFKR